MFIILCYFIRISPYSTFVTSPGSQKETAKRRKALKSIDFQCFFLFTNIAEYRTILPIAVCKSCTSQIVYNFVHGYTDRSITDCY